jgi:hypothetical protein
MIQNFELPKLRSLPVGLEDSYRELLRHDARATEYQRRLDLAKADRQQAIVTFNVDDDVAVSKWVVNEARFSLMQGWLSDAASRRSLIARALELDLTWLSNMCKNCGQDHTTFGQWINLDTRVTAAVLVAQQLIETQNGH